MIFYNNFYLCLLKQTVYLRKIKQHEKIYMKNRKRNLKRQLFALRRILEENFGLQYIPNRAIHLRAMTYADSEIKGKDRFPTFHTFLMKNKLIYEEGCFIRLIFIDLLILNL